MDRDSLDFKKQRHIKQAGLNRTSISIKLNKRYSLHIITSYTKHGNEYEAIENFNEVQSYIDSYTCPYVWGATSTDLQDNSQKSVAPDLVP